MKNIFKPEATGKWHPDRLSKDIIPTLTDRIRNRGLLASAALNVRNSYEVQESGYDTLHFRSTNLLTGITIGLNDVTIRVSQMEANTIGYTIRYKIWAKYSIFLCFGIVFFSLGIFLFMRHSSMSQGLNGISLSGNSIPLFLLIGNALFWGLIWPWILIVIHRKHACRALEHILKEENDILLKRGSH